MNSWALLSLVGSSVCIGTMAQLRKRYQVQNGAGMFSLMMFVLISSAVGSLVGLGFGGAVPMSGTVWLIAAGYALISMVSCAICLSGTAFGSLTVLMTIAQLGALVLPSAYGLLFLPEENQFTLWRGLGYLLALACIALNFVGAKREKSKKTLVFNILCAVLFFSNGSALILYDFKNRYTVCSNEDFITAYMAISVLLAVLVLLALGMMRPKTVNPEIKKTIRPISLLLAVGYALFFYTGETLALWSSKRLAITVQSTLSFAIPLIVVVLIDFLLYKEKPTKIAYVQMVLAFLCGLCFVL